jgi:hypothetical protein
MGLIKHREVIWGSRGISPSFLTLTLDGDEWSAFCPAHSICGKRAPGTHWIGGCVGPRAGLDVMERERKISCALLGIKP